MKWVHGYESGFRFLTIQMSQNEAANLDRNIKGDCGCVAVMKASKKFFVPCKKKHHFGSVEILGEEGEVREVYA